MTRVTPHPDDLHIAVLGAGSWGTALAILAARHYPTLLWARRPDAARQLTAQHENAAYLPGVRLPDTLTVSSNLARVWPHLAAARHALIILAVPVSGLADTCQALRDGLAQHSSANLVWTCKGVDADTAQLPHETVAQVLGDTTATGVLSGPSFAHEVARGLPVALTIASASPALRTRVVAALHGEPVRIYGSTDVVGVEVGGALKNVIALACGICDGLQLGANARAALITRGLAEMSRFGLALGARADTFAGLTGLGDLVLTATGDLSRNRQVGLALGQGRALADILAAGITAEGARCAQAVLNRARLLGVEMPITAAVCDVLFHGKSPAAMASALLTRKIRTENLSENLS